MMMLGLFCMAASFFPLYLKYRVVLTGERCRGKITGIVEQKCGYTVGGVAVKKHAYRIKIGQKQYYTAHGCLILPLGRKKIGKEIWVFKNEKYGREVFQCSDIRLELLSGLFLLVAVFSFSMEMIQ